MKLSASGLELNQVWYQIWNNPEVATSVGLGTGVWPSAIAAEFGIQIWQQIRDQVLNQVRDQVRNQVEIQVMSQVMNQVWESL
jgi:hypothetical protein